MTTLEPRFNVIGEWEALDEHHWLRIVTFKGNIVGGVLKHHLPQTEVECDPGLILWEPVDGVQRPLYFRNERSGQPLSLTPFIVCAICGDKGFVNQGKWVPKTDSSGLFGATCMNVLEDAAEFDEAYDDDGDPHGYKVAVRRDLGDTVPEEEEGADRKLYSMDGSGDVDTSDRAGTMLETLGEIEDRLNADVEPAVKQGGSVPMTHEMLRDVRESERIHREAADRPVKDSGHRRTFDTGAQRDRAAGKGRYDLLQVLALPRIAIILEKGAEKYEPRNFEKGMPLSTFMDSALRHIMQYIAGKQDEDHLGQAAWNLLSAMQMEEMIALGVLSPDLNDLPNYYSGTDFDE